MGSRAAVAAALMVVALVACGGDDTRSTTTQMATTTTATPSISTTTTTPEPVPTTTATPPTTTAEDQGVSIEIVVSGDEIEGDDRYPVALGSAVTISVAADVDEEVHVHGYDLFADIEPGAPGVITFIADIPGIFEVELESSHRLLFELVVSQ